METKPIVTQEKVPLLIVLKQAALREIRETLKEVSKGSYIY